MTLFDTLKLGSLSVPSRIFMVTRPRCEFFYTVTFNLAELVLRPTCRKYTPSTRDTYPFPNPYQHVNTVKMSELIITSSAYIINGDSPMTSVANTVAMTTLAVHTLQPLIFYTTLERKNTRRNHDSKPGKLRAKNTSVRGWPYGTTPGSPSPRRRRRRRPLF